MLNSVREQKQVILHMIVESNKNEQIPRKRQRIGNGSRVPQGQLPKLDPLDFDVLRSRFQLWQRPVRASSPTTSDASANSVQIGAVLKSELANYSAFLAIQNKNPTLNDCMPAQFKICLWRKQISHQSKPLLVLDENCKMMSVQIQRSKQFGSI